VNTAGIGTGNGQVIISWVPTVTTPAVSDLLDTTATLTGMVTADGGLPVTERGVVYAPTATNSSPQLGGAGVSSLAAGSGEGSFTAALTGLTPNTTYSYAAYAISSAATSYSSVGTFTTLKTSTTTSVGTSGSPSTLGAAVTFTATLDVATAGVGTPTGAVTFSDGGTALCGGSGQPACPTIGTTIPYQATLQVSSLAVGSDPITASYSGDTTYASSTSSSLTQVVNGPPTLGRTTLLKLADVTATLGASVTSDGGGATSLAVTERGIVFAPTAADPAPQIGDGSATAVQAGSGVGSFTATLTGLTPGTAYSYAAYATNSVGTGYSSVGTFTAVDVTVVSPDPSAGQQTFSYTGGLQEFVVPTGVTHLTIQAIGAQGGMDEYVTGGKGASIQGEFDVTPGSTLTVLAGGMDSMDMGTFAGGGGGGSFVWTGAGFAALAASPTAHLLVAAGGGGGSAGVNHISGTLGYGGDATVPAAGAGTTSSPGGLPPHSSCLSFGGTGGGGGGVQCGLAGGGGGGGLIGSGGNGPLGRGADGSTACTAGIGGGAIIDGGLGGAGGFQPSGQYADNATGSTGGFGGGGGTGCNGTDFGGAGGGGGYNGGVGGVGVISIANPNNVALDTPGGGGGSYNAGSNQVNTAGVGIGYGQVTITWQPPVTMQSQTVSFTSSAPSNAAYGDTYTPTAGADSGLPVTLAATGACSYDDSTGTVSMTAVGTCTVTASQAGNSAYSPASATQSFDVGQANQTITFGTLANHTYGDSPVLVNATASSGLPVSLAASGACTLSGTTVTITGAGSCTVTASQNGNGNYTAATSVSQTFTIAKATTTTTVTSSVNPSLVKQGVTLTVQVASGASAPGGTVTISDGATTLASGVSLDTTGTATFTTSALAAGTHSVTASYGGNANFAGSATSSPLSQQVRYNVNVLSTANLTVVLQLLDYNTTNVSASTLTVTAQCVVPYSQTPPTACGATPVQTITKAFGFTNSYKGLGPAYSYSVNPHGLTKGQQYDLLVQTDGDPIWHAVPFTA
jgi:hypothetical protein